MPQRAQPERPEWVARLSEPPAHPHDPDAEAGLETIQTHLSYVFLSRGRVYKFRKPVRLPFVDFSRRAERNADCLREVQLNRRLAPDVYLGVAPLLPSDAGWVVGAPREDLLRPDGESAEHCVVMRRLPAGRDALSLLEAGALTTAQLDRLAERMASFHEANTLGTPAPFDADDWLARCTEPTKDSFLAVHESGVEVGDALEPARARAEAFAREQAGRFERRRQQGRAVDAHGDLHLQHVWFERDDAPPVVIDCLEFDARLRHIDVSAEVAFTAMDLGYRGHPALGGFFLRRYARSSGDFGLYDVVDFFVGYRAAVRAKVAAIAATDRAIAAHQRERAAESARRHVAFANDALAPRSAGALVLVGGIVGTGKSTLAEALALALDATPGVAVVSSDRLRKRLAGLRPDQGARAAPDRGLYEPDRVRETYGALLEQARPICRSGRAAILDATWSTRAERRRAWELARELGARALFVEARCDPDVTLERLRRRAEAGTDPSDAGPELYARSAERFEALEADEIARRRIVSTDARDWRERIPGIAREISASDG